MANFLRALCLLHLLFRLGFAQFDLMSLQQNPFFAILDMREDEAEVKEDKFEIDYLGRWDIVSENAGVSAMHIVLFPNNKAIMFDAANLGRSTLSLPKGNCRPFPVKNEYKPGSIDCWAHAIEFDIDTFKIRPLEVLTDPWCSSGGQDADGNLVNSGGWYEGGKAMRYLKVCDTCDWEEYPTALSGTRWYATQAILADGRFIVVGGRKMFNYEFVPVKGQKNRGNFYLPLLDQTTDLAENNLYPFVHLSTDGNLFIFANSRSILLNPTTNKVIREFPVLPGGSRNYPASGMSALLPIKLHGVNAAVIQAEVIICGGAKPEAFLLIDKQNKMLPALDDCAKISITKPNAVWRTEKMPTPRVMGDMLILPTGDLLMINGAKKGTSAWEFADDPNFTPVIYSPRKPKGERFKELKPSEIPRMYHSTSAVLPDGTILVSGSNTNNRYVLKGVKYPTELRVEKFSPPYLDKKLADRRPEIMTALSQNKIKYGMKFLIQFKLGDFALDKTEIMVTMYRPPFTTHGYSMDQRLLKLAIIDVIQTSPGIYNVVALAPPTGAIAPPGYYLIFVVHKGLPSPGIWVQIK